MITDAPALQAHDLHVLWRPVSQILLVPAYLLLFAQRQIASTQRIASPSKQRLFSSPDLREMTLYPNRIALLGEQRLEAIDERYDAHRGLED